MGVLEGIRVIEIAGIGPGPFCGMLLADMGAEVILVERAGTAGVDMLDLGKSAIINRGKRSLALNLKDPQAVDAVLRSIDGADAGLRAQASWSDLDSDRRRVSRAIRVWSMDA